MVRKNGKNTLNTNIIYLMNERKTQNLSPTGGLGDQNPDETFATNGEESPMSVPESFNADATTCQQSLNQMANHLDSLHHYEERMLKREEEDLVMKRSMLNQRKEMAGMLRQLSKLIRKMEKQHCKQLVYSMHDVVREELLRSNLVTSDVPQPTLVMKQMTAVLMPWLTQRKEREQLFKQHFLPIIGEKKVWMEADRVCIQSQYLSKFIRALFLCMDEYHLGKFHTQHLESCVSLRKFLEKRVCFKRDGKICEPHLMVPIERAAPKPT